MANEHDTITDQDLDTLEKFGEQARQDDETAELMEAIPSVVQRGGIYLISGAVLISLILLWFGRAHSVVSAEGQIVPQGESVPMQALEGGVVTDVLAQPGDRLLAGDPVLRVDRTRSGMSLAALERQRTLQEAQLNALSADSAHLARALADPMAFAQAPLPQLRTGASQQLATQVRLAALGLIDAEANTQQRLERRQAQMRRELDLARQRVVLLEKDRADQAEQLERAREDLEEFRSMAERGFFSEQDVQAEEQQFRQRQQRLETLDLDIANEKLRLGDLEGNIANEASRAARDLEQARADYRKALTDLQLGLETQRSEIRRLDAELANTRDELGLQQQRVANTSVSAPMAGTVAGMNITNSGEIVSAGQVIGVLIPEGAPLVVKAQVPNKDIGFVTEGLETRIKVEAFPFQQFGTIPGRVMRVYPNAGGSQNFTVLIELLESTIEVGDRTVSLFPGLSVNAEMLTHKQRLLTLLMSSEGG